MGLVAPRHVGSSQTRDRPVVHCTGRWTINHWTTKEVPGSSFKMETLYLETGLCL